jgi:hypothetical protein
MNKVTDGLADVMMMMMMMMMMEEMQSSPCTGNTP